MGIVEPLPAEVLPPASRVLVELLAKILDEHLGTARGVCRLELELHDGKLKWLQPSPRVPASKLGDFEGSPV